jgi:hypothetical protein
MTSHPIRINGFGHPTCNGYGVGRVPHDPHRSLNGEEGAHLKDGTGCYHLPLRGKLGWMTPLIRLRLYGIAKMHLGLLRSEHCWDEHEQSTRAVARPTSL